MNNEKKIIDLLKSFETSAQEFIKKLRKFSSQDICDLITRLIFEKDENKSAKIAKLIKEELEKRHAKVVWKTIER
jgi:hypothetical protein